VGGGAYALLVDDSLLYVGGTFTQTGDGAPLTRAARWTWNPPSGSGVVSAAPGSAVTIEGTGLIGVNSATVGGLTVPIDYSASSGTSITITLPGGLGIGSHQIVADAVGGLGVIGSYVVPAPTPPPTFPSDPPTGVSAEAGDASALVSWSAPSSSGCYPVTTYLATSSPGGKTCLVSAPARECEVVGLTNGTSYTFTVQALTGAGWSDPSSPSNAVTPTRAPEPSIVITGTRTQRLAAVSGTTTGFGMGAMLTPWIRLPGSGAFEQGKITVLVSMDGTFTWERRMRPGRPLAVYFSGGGVRSNTLTLR